MEDTGGRGQPSPSSSSQTNPSKLISSEVKTADGDREMDMDVEMAATSLTTVPPALPGETAPHQSLAGASSVPSGNGPHGSGRGPAEGDGGPSTADCGDECSVAAGSSFPDSHVVCGPGNVTAVKETEEPERRGGGDDTKEEEEEEEEEEETFTVNLPRQQHRFYFESDALVLKSNPDYQKLLKTLAVLEAQKIQAIKDLECLLEAQSKAMRDPLGFVERLRNGTLEPLPTRQTVAEIPDIQWKGYIDSLQAVAKQRSSVYLHTRRQSHLLENKMVSGGKPSKSSSAASTASASASNRQLWTPEEQARFEELLRIHPPEAIEKRRFEKISNALGTRTTQQVASHAQKYFIKLAKAGLPVPGRMPNLANYTKSKKSKRSRHALNRPSTFFSSLAPKVFMPEGEGVASRETSIYDDSTDDDDDSIISELVPASYLYSSSPSVSGEATPTQTAVKCSNCGAEVAAGVYWECTECPVSTTLCSNCANCEYCDGGHSPSHDMKLLSLSSNAIVDRDYTSFAPQPSLQTQYNYLDPNFFPAS